MEPLENSNGLGQSMNESFSLYEHYMRSFNIVDSRVETEDIREPYEPVSPGNFYCGSSSSRGNIDLSTAQSNAINKHNLAESECSLLNHDTCDNIPDKFSDFESIKAEADYQSNSPAAESLDNSSTTTEHSHLTEKSYQTGFLLVSSEETKREYIKPPLFLTSTMENSNNAVDSVPMFHNVRQSENVFKLPNIELTFNGTIKHVQKLTPIVDPVSALSSQSHVMLEGKPEEQSECCLNIKSNADKSDTSSDQKTSDVDEKSIDVETLEKTSESTGDSQYEEINPKTEFLVNDDESSTNWNLEHSYSSFEASFDSGVRSPDMFSDDDDYADDENEQAVESEPFWDFLKHHEAFDKRKVKKLEETLQGVLPPPSVTIIKTDVTEMLKKYYNFLPLFNENAKLNVSEEANSTTPTKRVSFIEIPELQETSRNAEDVTLKIGSNDVSHPSSSPEAYVAKMNNVITRTGSADNSRPGSSLEPSLSKMNNCDIDTNVTDKTVDLKVCTETEAVETMWPDLLKCRHHDVYYNVSKFSEKFELLALKYGERYVGAETDTSVNIHSGGFQSPSSANKRKALRLKLAQAKSPGRRLSHLARRRQAFCSAATINEKAQASNSKMVLIDKKKLINSSERKSPRLRRTPGKRTPNRKTPGKKTPAKTPKTRSGGSSKKKAMRRLLMDSESMTRSQPSRETLKRALFISPENRKPVPPAPSTSVPLNAMKTKRALFGSPVRADTKSSDGTQSDQFLKRKRNSFDDIPETNRSKIAKSLSFGGGTIGSSQPISITRRASEVFTGKRSSELNDNHKQKLLWAVSEALRVHGWRMSSPGFREKATNLARLTRRLLTLTPYASRMTAPNLSTSDIMLKMARKYVFAIIRGRTVEDCFEEEQTKLANEANSKVTGYISANAYQQIKARQIATTSSNPQIKENSCSNPSFKQEPKSGTKNVLQDKLVNIDSNSNSSSGMSMIDKASLGIFKSNSMPSFEETAKIRARRQISFDNVDFPKR